MSKIHLLLTFGKDYTSQYKLNFLSTFFKNKAEVELTLYYAAPKSWEEDAPCVLWLYEGDQAGACDTGGGDKILAQAKDKLVGNGFLPENIHTKVICSNHSAMGEILNEAVAGLYDAVVLGCRGLGLMSSIMDTSVSRELLAQGIDFPVWICHRAEYNPGDVLLCLGEDDPSLRMADHVGFILNMEPSKNVTLLHVHKPGKHDQEDVVPRAVAVLTENGVEPERIRIEVVTAKDVNKTILREIEHGGYSAAAVGMTEGNCGFPRCLVAEHTGFSLLKKVDKTSLWVMK